MGSGGGGDGIQIVKRVVGEIDIRHEPGATGPAGSPVESIEADRFGQYRPARPSPVRSAGVEHA